MKASRGVEEPWESWVGEAEGRLFSEFRLLS